MSKTTINGVTSSISVSVAAAATLAVSTPSTVTAGTTFTFNVTSLDNSGQPFTSYTGTVSFTSTDGQAVLPANSSLTNGTGTFSGTLKTDGNQTITATDSAAASITGTSTSIHVLVPASGFTPTGSMQTTREDHTATLLNDGRVLVAGGMHWGVVNPCFQGTRCFQLNALASAEIFDPATGAFTSTGKMSVERTNHTATLLGDGRVLITGGDDRRAPVFGTAEIFDPSTDVFTLTGNMVMARRAHTATPLKNGKVLLAGGDGANGNIPSTAELFDPATGEFSPTGNMTASRSFQTATLLSDGRVLLAGGDTSGATATAELYDPLTGKFTATGSMTVTRTGHRATLLNNGKVLMTGGTSPGSTSTAELFDAATGTFVPTGNMVTGRELHTATLLTNGKVLLTGGIDPNSIYLATQNCTILRMEHSRPQEIWRSSALITRQFCC
jgi:Galactose oxidase, central domain